MSQEKQEGDFSLKGKKIKPKNLGKTQNEPIKVDLSKNSEEQDVTKVVINAEEDTTEGVVQEVIEEVVEENWQEDEIEMASDTDDEEERMFREKSRRRRRRGGDENLEIA